MRMLIALVFAIALPAAACAAASPPSEAPPAAAIDRDVATVMARGVKGVSILVTRDDAPVFQKAYGIRDASSGAPATADTMFEIGSNTKHFTAAAVLQLVNAGKIDLDVPLARYLPSAPHANEVTIRQLLSHTSGIHEYLEGLAVYALGGKHHTPDDIVATIANKPLDFKPGTKWSYSNTNYILLGMVIERVSGQSYLQYMHQHVFDAAGVPGIATIVDEPKLPNVARGYSHGQPSAALDDTYAWAAGDIVANASQLAALDEALVRAKIVTAAGYALMSSVQSPPNGQPYGFGLIPDTYLGQPRVWHNGGTFGQSSTDQYYPVQHMRIVILANDDNAGIDQLGDKIFGDFYPKFAASQLQAMPGENKALTARFRGILVALLDGRIDRSQFDAAANAKLTDALLAQVKSSFADVCEVQSLTYKGVQQRGGLSVYTYLAKTSGGLYKLTVGTDPDGKLNTIFLGSP